MQIQHGENVGSEVSPILLVAGDLIKKSRRNSDPSLLKSEVTDLVLVSFYPFFAIAITLGRFGDQEPIVRPL